MPTYRVVWPKPRATEIEESVTPEPGADQLLIRSRLSLISPGTERAFYLGLPNTTDRYPQYPGYSLMGEVERVGEGVKGWSIGDRVVCAASHASRVAAKASQCLPVPADLPDEQALFFNLASIAMQGVRKARVELGESVAVVGAGVIGLLAMKLASVSGGLPVISVDLDDRRLEFARQLGADETLKADDGLLPALSALTGEGASVVIEATGNPDAVTLAFSLARQFGRVVLLGSTRGETDHVNFYRDIHKKGITVIGAHANAVPSHNSTPGFWTMHDEQKTALRLMAAGRLNVEPFITHRFSWREAPQAYELLGSWEKEALGMTLNWQ
jgi:2-desacetyl-2-hydroxyethyl bacteriochlorophyllide A dehydrogenase